MLQHGAVLHPFLLQTSIVWDQGLIYTCPPAGGLQAVLTVGSLHAVLLRTLAGRSCILSRYPEVKILF